MKELIRTNHEKNDFYLSLSVSKETVSSKDDGKNITDFEVSHGRKTSYEGAVEVGVK